MCSLYMNIYQGKRREKVMEKGDMISKMDLDVYYCITI